MELQRTAAEEDLKKAQEKTNDVKKRIAESEARLKKDLADICSELATEEKRLTGDVAKEYRHLVEKNGESALAKSDGKTCGNCYHTFTTQTLSNLLARKAVYCKGCGCMMYTLTEVNAGN